MVDDDDEDDDDDDDDDIRHSTLSYAYCNTIKIRLPRLMIKSR